MSTRTSEEMSGTHLGRFLKGKKIATKEQEARAEKLASIILGMVSLGLAFGYCLFVYFSFSQLQ